MTLALGQRVSLGRWPHSRCGVRVSAGRGGRYLGRGSTPAAFLLESLEKPNLVSGLAATRCCVRSAHHFWRRFLWGTRRRPGQAVGFRFQVIEAPWGAPACALFSPMYRGSPSGAPWSRVVSLQSVVGPLSSPIVRSREGPE
ncbi:hypothetical protein NDU88_004308 [Pleurodeles waltl]|uniref:Uncharacterized protein n=1 Tax=Pleurodeles waltl TaxID=8319 RepID=A0AAV7WVH8_PLEWA|nr:hypothetical protein NDU88_004308 [Pleurodeles waltl]